MLVAEEYERRVKNARKIGGENEEIDMFSSVSVLARGVEWSSWINRNLGEEKMELVKKAMEPRSQIGLDLLGLLLGEDAADGGGVVDDGEGGGGAGEGMGWRGG
ncbi:hypothetical protein RHSIM_Rhsim10G0155600 [Rhododendron simsii]|uniref:Uncharacterized protein n=1 Tax=Rhododendron simsii TaxID=118357 RepID=A0A834GBV4_RHOSS|nr:hypothetical protein RHSIM_Rhsim10G0155600 [Rhododendron simsii]